MKNQLTIMILNTIINGILAVFKIVIGFIFGSELLIADGLHSASDLLTDIFSVIGLKFAKKPSDDDHPFGHGNLEYAASLTVSIIILVMVYGLTTELISNWNILSSEVSMIVLGVSIITFFAKLMLSSYILKKSKELDSHTLKSSAIESRSDAYSTIIVILGLVLTYIGIRENINFLKYSEKIATIVVIIMLFKVAITIYFDSIVGIAGTVASKEIHNKFKALIKEDETYRLKNILVMKQGIHYAVLVRIIFNEEISIRKAEESINKIRENLKREEKIQKVSVEFIVK